MTLIIQEEMSKYTDMRKHHTQMNAYERRELMKRLASISEEDWVVRPHAFDRISEKRIRATRNDMVTAIHNAKLIEYRIIGRMNEERVLIRSRRFVNGRNNLNIVYSLTYKEVITVWLNHRDDKHTTLDWSIYNKDMKVFGI